MDIGETGQKHTPGKGSSRCKVQGLVGSRVWGQELSFCLQCHRKEEDNGEQQPEATEGQVTGRESQEELSPPLPLPYLGFSLTGEGDKTGRVISGLLTTTSDTHSEGTLVGHTNSKIHWKAASNKLAPFTNPVLL